MLTPWMRRISIEIRNGSPLIVVMERFIAEHIWQYFIIYLLFLKNNSLYLLFSAKSVSRDLLRNLINDISCDRIIWNLNMNSWQSLFIKVVFFLQDLFLRRQLKIHNYMIQLVFNVVHFKFRITNYTSVVVQPPLWSNLARDTLRPAYPHLLTE